MCPPNRIVRTSAAVLVAGSFVAGCGGDRAPTAATSTAAPQTAARSTAPSDQRDDTDRPGGATSSTAPKDAGAKDAETAPEPTTGESGPESTAAAPTDTESAHCRRLTDFDGRTTDDWFVVDDGVMGGRSSGSIEIADSALRFTGDVVTRGGGFTSVRLRLTGDELTGSNRIDMRVRADRRTYGLTFEDDSVAGQRSISHRADLVMPRQRDGWTVVTLPYTGLVPSVFGQPVESDPFDPDEARQIGIIISDGTDGEFSLDVDWIDACR